MMWTDRERTVLFWSVCLPVRAAVALSAFRARRTPYERALRAVAAAVGAQWLLGMQTARVGFFGGHVWWARERPWHGVLWLCYGLKGCPEFLAADTILGGANWVWHRSARYPLGGGRSLKYMARAVLRGAD